MSELTFLNHGYYKLLRRDTDDVWERYRPSIRLVDNTKYRGGRTADTSYAVRERPERMC